ncbi:MAG: 23S rRNA (uracil(1939)-C(5))-methyltransferase RlmD [Proteobacteria bacterium]|nr:23S rRNA (uracil(1939)-C(5))-methyltransferase RlmD [Pseudomonadota bacterium]
MAIIASPAFATGGPYASVRRRRIGIARNSQLEAIGGCNAGVVVSSSAPSICDNARPHRPRAAVSRQRFSREPFETTIDDLSHDGRGVARRDGKAVFVRGALPGERVMAQPTARHRHYDEAAAIEVLEASPDRVEPKCAHFGHCSGCVLQHLGAEKQIQAKQRVLIENLERIGHVAPRRILPPLTAAPWGYRRKGRLSVRYVEKKGRTLVGFREDDPRFVADIRRCETVVPAIGTRIEALARMIDGLDGKRHIPQIEFIVGDMQPGDAHSDDAVRDEGVVALVFRHVEPLSEGDRAALVAFAQAHGFALYLQPGGVDSVRPLWPEAGVALEFALSGHDLRLAFQPLDFIQVNAGMNAKMIALALELLDPQPGQRILDLFCGLGNFTLPIARRAAEVVGVEGDAGLVARARANAQRNGIANARFFAADLASALAYEPWLGEPCDALLLDPPRSGAEALLPQLPLKQIGRVVYVSCHPGSLARDAGFLVRERGFTLRAAGVMDMFPHTAHVESIAVFER